MHYIQELAYIADVERFMIFEKAASYIFNLLLIEILLNNVGFI